MALLKDVRELLYVIGARLRMQVALRRGQLRVAHHVLNRDEVELLDREAAEGVSQVVEATHSHAGLFLGADEAAADGGAVERGAVRSAENMVGVAREARPLPQSLQFRGCLLGEGHGAGAP
jgi:hypothetical protein